LHISVTRQPLLKPEQKIEQENMSKSSAVNSFATTGGKLLPRATSFYTIFVKFSRRLVG